MKSSGREEGADAELDPQPADGADPRARGRTPARAARRGWPRCRSRAAACSRRARGAAGRRTSPRPTRSTRPDGVSTARALAAGREARVHDAVAADDREPAHRRDPMRSRRAAAGSVPTGTTSTPLRLDALGEPLVGGDDADRVGIADPGHPFRDLVVGGVAPAGRERHPQPPVGRAARRRALLRGSTVEHDRHLLPARGDIALQLRHQLAHRPRAVLPPAVGPRSDQVHAVDQPARRHAAKYRCSEARAHDEEPSLRERDRATGLSPGRIRRAASRRARTAARAPSRTRRAPRRHEAPPSENPPVSTASVSIPARAAASDIPHGVADHYRVVGLGHVERRPHQVRLGLRRLDVG